MDGYKLRRIGKPDNVMSDSKFVPVGYLGMDRREYWNHAPNEASAIVVGSEAGGYETAEKVLESYLREHGFERIEKRNGRIIASDGNRKLELFFNGRTESGSYQFNIDFSNSRL